MILRWVARIGSVLSIGLLAAFVFGDFGSPTLREWSTLVLFPGGVVAGMIWGWWNELRGGMLTTVSLLGFYALMFAFHGKLPGGPYFLFFASPGLLFAVYGIAVRARAE